MADGSQALPANAVRARVEALEARLTGIFGVPAKVIEAYALAVSRAVEPTAPMVAVWFGSEIGPGAIAAGREWLERLRAAERQAVAVLAPAAPPVHLAAMRHEDSEGVPLEHYLRQHPGAAVRFECLACAKAYDVPLADVVAGLEARGDGDGKTGVRAVARLVRKPCARCGERRFETRPAFPGRDGGGLLPPAGKG